MNARARRLAIALWPALLLGTSASLVATLTVRPRVLANFTAHPAALVIPLVVLVALVDIPVCSRLGRDRDAFVSSAVFLAAMLAGAAVAEFPILLPASSGSQLDLTIYNAAAGSHALRIGLVWWTAGIVLAVAYTVFVYRLFRGKVTEQSTKAER